MKTRFLNPLTFKDEYYSEVERIIKKIFYQAIFKELFEVIKKYGYEVKNAPSQNPVAEAIKAGKIFYADGELRGVFTAKISKAIKAMGGTFNANTKAWHLSFLPPEIQIAIAQSEALAEALQDNFIKVLDTADIQKAINEGDITPAYNKTLRRMNADFGKIVDKIAIPPTMTDQAREAISKSWATNLDLYIKGWADESILKLRQQIMQNTMRGQRAENMVSTIMSEYGSSLKKAKFLARQETSLLMSKFQEERYKDVGITKYRWSGAMDARERPDHKKLEGKIFSWNSPPVTNRQTGARNHPGQDYGCRCVAIAIAESAL